MGALGNYVAELIVDKSNFSKGLSDATDEYSRFLEKQKTDAEKQLALIKEVFENQTKTIVSSYEEMSVAIEGMTNKQQASLARRVGSYKKYNKEVAAEAQRSLAEEKKQIDEMYAIRQKEQKQIESMYKAREKELKKLSVINAAAEKQRQKEIEAHIADANKKAKAEEKATAVILKQKEKEAKAIETANARRLRDEEKAANKLRVQREKEIRQLEQLKQRVLSWSSIVISVPIILGTKQALKDFAEFQKTLFNVKAVTGATTAEMLKMTATAIEMSKVFSKTGKEIAEGFLELGQAGYDAAEILTSAKDIMILSSAGMKDIAFTSELVVTSLKAFGLEAKDSGRLIDVFAASASKSVSSLDKISASLKYTAGLWGAQRWDIENLVGTLDILYDTGVRGEKAGRLLASAINGLNKPTASASKVIQRLLGDVNALNPSMNDITSIVKKLAQANATTTDIFTIFGKEGTEVILRLLNNVDKLDGAIAEVTGQTGEATKQALIQMQSVASQFDILKNKVTAFSKEAIGAIEPAITSIIKLVGSFFDALSKLGDGTKAILSIAGVFLGLTPIVLKSAVAIKSAGVALGIFSASAVTAQVAIAPLTIIITALAASVAGIAVAYSNAQKKQQEWYETVSEGADKLKKSGKDIDSMVKSVRELYRTMGDTKEVREEIEKLAQVFPNLRAEMNKGATDTASAMSALNKEYATLKGLQAKEQQAGATLVSDKTKKALADAKASIAGYNAEIEESKTQQLNTQQAIKMVNDALGLQIQDFEQLMLWITNTDNATDKLARSVTDFIAAGTTEFTFLKKLEDTINKIETARAEQSRLQRIIAATGKTAEKTNAETETSFEKLAARIETIQTAIKNAQTSYRIQIELARAKGDTDEVERLVQESLKEAGKIAQDGLSDIMANYRDELVEFNVTDATGAFTDTFMKFFSQAKTKLEKYVNKQDGIDIISALAAKGGGVKEINAVVELFKEIQAKKEGINALDQKSADYAHRKTVIEKEYADLIKSITEGQDKGDTKLRDALRLMLALIDASEGLVKTGKEHSDWWTQIIDKIKGVSTLLNGIEGTELNKLTDVYESLTNKAGTAYDNLKKSVDEAILSMQADPDLKAISSVINLDDVIAQLRATLKLMKIELTGAFGIDVPYEKYLALKEQLLVTKSLLEGQMKDLDATSEKYKVLKTAIAGVEQQLLSLGVSYGAIPSFTADVAEFQKGIDERKKSVRELKKAFNDLSNVNLSTLIYLIDQIDPEKGLPEFLDSLSPDGLIGITNAMQQLEAVEQSLSKRFSEFWDSVESDKELTIEQREELDKLRIAMDMIASKKQTTIQLKIDGVNNVLGNINSLVSSIGTVKDAFTDLEATASEKMNSIAGLVSSVGGVVSAISPAVGGIIAALSASISIVSGIVSLFEKETTDGIAEALDNAIKQAKDEVQQTYEDIGVFLGQEIAGGISSGTSLSASDIQNTMKTLVFNMMSTALVTLSGFKDQIATIAETIWSELSPSSQQANELQSQIDAVLETVDISSVKELYDAYEGYVEQLDALEAKNDAKSISIFKYIDQQGAILNDTTYKKVVAAYGKIKDLVTELAAIDITINPDGISTETTDAIDKKTKNMKEMLEALYASLGVVAKDGASDLVDSIAQSLSEAVLTGSYKDFRDAVYQQITSQIINAAVSAYGIKDKVQTLIDKVFSATDKTLSVEDIATLSTGIADLHNDVASNTDIQALREALAQFGTLDVEVNPAQVVTALPSETEQKLVTAIQSVAENLSQAITEAGLNSYIEAVSITTANITQMLTDTVTIQSAEMNMSGDIVVGSISGSYLESYIEEVVLNTLNLSKP